MIEVKAGAWCSALGQFTGPSSDLISATPSPLLTLSVPTIYFIFTHIPLTTTTFPTLSFPKHPLLTLLWAAFLPLDRKPQDCQASEMDQPTPGLPGWPRLAWRLGLTSPGADSTADTFSLEVVIVPLATSIDKWGADFFLLIIPPAHKEGIAGARNLWQSAHICREIEGQSCLDVCLPKEHSKHVQWHGVGGQRNGEAWKF